ncbi:MAG: hypothetical protein HC888_19830 [Candidatus Competibacteraceae bacterium]|nr:hypothetical protein [Candidatus Competibacteraceae bacterium]
MGTDWLAVDRDRIEFHGGDDVRVDCRDFVAEIRGLRSCCEDGRFRGQEDVERLRGALTLYQGGFLEGLNLKDAPEFDEWQALTREDLLHHAGWALERVVEIDAAEGNLAPALKAARRWLALDTLNESAHRALMLLLARDGKQSAALRQYESCERLLRDELGQEPDEETADLAERIRLRKLESAISRQASAGAQARSDDAPPSDRPSGGSQGEAPVPTKFSPPRIRSSSPRVKPPSLPPLK